MSQRFKESEHAMCQVARAGLGPLATICDLMKSGHVKPVPLRSPCLVHPHPLVLTPTLFLTHHLHILTDTLTLGSHHLRLRLRLRGAQPLAVVVRNVTSVLPSQTRSSKHSIART